MTTAMIRHAVGVDFGGTSTKIALVNERGQIKARKKIATRDIGSPEAWLDVVVQAVEQFKHAEVVGGHALAGVGVGVPGFVDFERGLIYELPNVPGWTEVPLADLLRRRLDLRVRVDNDVNAMAQGECTFGAGRTYQHAVFITLGTGVGGGILINNRLYRGAYSMAGEIGHVSIDMNGIVSPQGRGGVEQYVGNRRIVERTIKALESGRCSMLDELCGGDRSAITPQTIKQAADKGDELALEILNFMADCLGCALASVTYLLQPQAFIVGGGVAEDADLLFELIRKHLRARLSPHFAQRIEVKPAELGNDAGVIGAATLAMME